jgi:hypothetical protein
MTCNTYLCISVFLQVFSDIPMCFLIHLTGRYIRYSLEVYLTFLFGISVFRILRKTVH